MAEAQENSLPEEQSCPVCTYEISYPICECHCGQRMCHYCFFSLNVCPKCTLLKIEAEPCPFRNRNLCPWWGVRSKLKSHLMEKHSSNFYVKEEQRLLSHNFKNGLRDHYNVAVFHAYGEFFWLTWDVEFRTGETQWVVYYMGPPEKAKRYSYTIEFPCETSFNGPTSSFVLKTTCEPVPEYIYEFENHSCFNIHKKFLEKYCDFNGDLNYRITIHCNNSDSNDYITYVRYLFTDVSDTD